MADADVLVIGAGLAGLVMGHYQAEEAALDIGLGRYASWKDAERIAVNVDTVWREWSGTADVTPALELFGRMGRIYFDRK